MHPVEYERWRMDFRFQRQVGRAGPSQQGRPPQIVPRRGSQRPVEALPLLAKCAPMCAPKVHGAMHAAPGHWQSTGMTLASTLEKTRIP